MSFQWLAEYGQHESADVTSEVRLIHVREEDTVDKVIIHPVMTARRKDKDALDDELVSVSLLC